MDIAEIFGKRITSLRNERGLSSEELSEIISLSEKTIIKLESGQRNPTIPEVAVFGRFFNVSFDYLLGKSEDRIAKDFIEEAGGNRRLASILQLMRSLSKEEAEAVLQKLLTMDLTSPEK